MSQPTSSRETIATRIAPLEPPFAPGVAETLAKMMPPGVPPLALFRVVARNPRVLDKLWLANLLDRGSLQLRDREIVILRTTARCGSEYEWGIHVAYFGSRAKLSDEQIGSTAHGGPGDSAWSDGDRLLIRLADELHDRSTISDDLWTELSRRWTAEQLVELVMLAGMYHSIAFVTNAFAIPPEIGAARF